MASSHAACRILCILVQGVQDQWQAMRISTNDESMSACCLLQVCNVPVGLPAASTKVRARTLDPKARNFGGILAVENPFNSSNPWQLGPN